MAGLTIGQLAKATHVSAHTIRFYERKGLLIAARRRASGYREFASADRRRLQFIIRARRLGLSLYDVAELVSLLDTGNRNEAGRITAKYIRLLQTKIAELERGRRGLIRMQQLATKHWREAERSATLDLFDEEPAAAADSSGYEEQFHESL